MMVFKENFEMIEAHNADADQTYVMAANQFMDLTTEEFAATYLTLYVEPRDVEETESVSAPAAAINWVAKGDVSPVKNQGSCGSCWAFSANAQIESWSRINGKGQVNLSEQQLVDCSRSFGNQGCNGGWMDNAFQYIVKYGITSTAEYPYAGRDQTCKFNGGNFHIGGFTDVAAGNCGSLTTALGGQPVAVAVDATNWSFYAGGVFKNCAANLNHGVLLVGVDAAGNWNIKNSWGTGWGNAGFITLAPNNTCGLCNAASYVK